jgi:hypothetical protein
MHFLSTIGGVAKTSVTRWGEIAQNSSKCALDFGYILSLNSQICYKIISSAKIQIL